MRLELQELWAARTDLRPSHLHAACWSRGLQHRRGGASRFFQSIGLERELADLGEQVLAFGLVAGFDIPRHGAEAFLATFPESFSPTIDLGDGGVELGRGGRCRRWWRGLG